LDGIYQETEGNPFFIEEVCKTLVESGKLYFEEGRWQRPSMAEMEIPQSLRLAIQMRLGKLSPSTQETLLVAAVIGREFDFETLLKASNSDEEDLITALEEAERAQLIQEARGKEGEVFSFVHALVSMSLRKSVSVLRRHRLHRRVGEAIQALRADDYEALAYHYSQAGDEERAFPFTLQAGKRAAAAYANQEAEGYYRAALEMAGPGPERGELLSELGRVLARLGRFPEAIQAWREAITLYMEIGDHDKVAWLYARMARAAWWGGGPTEGLKLCQEGLSAVPAGSDSAAMAYLLQETGRAYQFNNQTDQALLFCQRALTMARQHGDQATQAEALTTIGTIPGIDADQALQALEEAVQIAETAGVINQAGRAHHNLGWFYHIKIGDSLQARWHYRRAAEIDRQRGALADFVFSQSTAAYHSLLLGETQLAQAFLQECRQLLPDSPTSGKAEIILEIWETTVLQFTGQLGRAKDIFEKNRKEALAKGYLEDLLYIDRGLGPLLNVIGETEKAEDILKEGIQVGEFVYVDNRSRNALIEVLLCQGKVEEARTVQEEAEKAAAVVPGFINQTFLTWGEARLAAAERRWDVALEKYAQLSETLEARGLRL